MQQRCNADATTMQQRCNNDASSARANKDRSRPRSWLATRWTIYLNVSRSERFVTKVKSRATTLARELIIPCSSSVKRTHRANMEYAPLVSRRGVRARDGGRARLGRREKRSRVLLTEGDGREGRSVVPSYSGSGNGGDTAVRSQLWCPVLSVRFDEVPS